MAMNLKFLVCAVCVMGAIPHSLIHAAGKACNEQEVRSMPLVVKIALAGVVAAGIGALVTRTEVISCIQAQVARVQEKLPAIKQKIRNYHIIGSLSACVLLPIGALLQILTGGIHGNGGSLGLLR